MLICANRGLHMYRCACKNTMFLNAYVQICMHMFAGEISGCICIDMQIQRAYVQICTGLPPSAYVYICICICIDMQRSPVACQGKNASSKKCDYANLSIVFSPYPSEKKSPTRHGFRKICVANTTQTCNAPIRSSSSRCVIRYIKNPLYFLIKPIYTKPIVFQPRKSETITKIFNYPNMLHQNKELP